MVKHVGRIQFFSFSFPALNLAMKRQHWETNYVSTGRGVLCGGLVTRGKAKTILEAPICSDSETKADLTAQFALNFIDWNKLKL